LTTFISQTSKHLSNVKLKKCQVVEMSSWTNVKWTKCQVDKRLRPFFPTFSWPRKQALHLDERANWQCANWRKVLAPLTLSIVFRHLKWDNLVFSWMYFKSMVTLSTTSWSFYMRAYSKRRVPVQTSIAAQCDNINVGCMMEKYNLGVIDDELMTSIMSQSCNPESLFMWYSFLVVARNRNRYKRDWNIFETF